jgi:hypothetical protein
MVESKSAWPRLWRYFIALFCVVLTCAPARASHKAEIGLTTLQAELGASTPTGVGVTISQVEAPEGSNYAPDSANAEFSGKTFVLKSGASGPSAHATGVGVYLYGTNTGVAPGITTIDCYDANDYVFSVLNYSNVVAAPDVETRRIQSHSWIGSLATGSQDAIRRLDYAIERDGFLAVVGVNNGSGNPVPDLLAHSYNGICVGQSNGDHSHGTTSFDVPGRVKPDIVAPSDSWFVSFTLPVVSGSAALLLQTADLRAFHPARTNSEVIKAILMAGATKHEFPTWNRTTTRPLDSIYGAGEVNVYRSYKILVAGEQGATNSSALPSRGWDFAPSSTTPARYFFDVPAGHVLTNFSALVTWNRHVYDAMIGPSYDFQVTVANLDLHLYSANNFTPVTLLDSSVSTVDNVEHIFTNQLGPGRYLLQLSSDLNGHDYAIAWTGTMLSPTTPGLTITRSSSTTTVTWPIWATDYILQQTTSLSTPITWTTIQSPYSHNGTNFTYTTTTTGQQRYFRLYRP